MMTIDIDQGMIVENRKAKPLIFDKGKHEFQE